MKQTGCVLVLVLCLASPTLGQISIGHVTAGAWDVYLSNRGGMGRDSAKQGGMWPRGSADVASYIHDGGFWFGCKRTKDLSQKLVELTFSPHNVPFGSGETSFRPLHRGTQAEPVYSSADYNANGTPRTAGLTAWCVRNVKGGEIFKNGNSGDYVRDSATRSGLPPVFLSDQDMVVAFSDSADSVAPYPLGLTGTTTMYAWNNDSLRNCVLVKTSVKNTSKDSLVECYFAPVFSFAIGRDSSNDDCGPYAEDSTLAMFTAHSEPEAGLRLGVVGIAVINPPRGVRFNGANVWGDFFDPYGDAGRYDNMMSFTLFPTSYATVRGLGSCGPFTLAPGKSAELVYAIAAGMDSAFADINDSNLVRLVRTVRAVRNYWLSFNTPSGIAESGSVPRTVQLSAYPNPFTSITRVSIPDNMFNGDRKQLKMVLLDELGRRMDASSVSWHDNRTIAIAAHRLMPGVYHLSITSGSHTFHIPVVLTHE